MVVTKDYQSVPVPEDTVETIFESDQYKNKPQVVDVDTIFSIVMMISLTTTTITITHLLVTKISICKKPINSYDHLFLRLYKVNSYDCLYLHLYDRYFYSCLYSHLYDMDFYRCLYSHLYNIDVYIHLYLYLYKVYMYTHLYQYRYEICLYSVSMEISLLSYVYK